MNYAAEMGSGAMIYTQSSIKFGSGIQKVMWGIHIQTQRNTHGNIHTDSKVIS
jgi:hypothetical protein